MVEANREILWNIGSVWNVVGMYLLMVVAMTIGGFGVYRRLLLWSSGQPAPEINGQIFKRIAHIYSWVFLQEGVRRDRSTSVAHTLIYVGFLVLLFATTMVFIHQDLGIEIYKGDFYLGVTVMADIFGFLALLGCGIFYYRRAILRPDRIHTQKSDLWIIGFIALMLVQGFVIEALRIHVTNDPWAAYSPVGYLLAQFFWGLTPEASSALHYIFWWFHTASVMFAVAVLPYTKFFHIIASSFNLFLRDFSRNKGELEHLGDIEKLMESESEVKFGTATIKDYSIKKLLELDACTSCGRCQEVCPAYKSGKPLSPKWLILDTRNHMLGLMANNKLAVGDSQFAALDRRLLSSMTLNGAGLVRDGDGFAYANGGEFRGANKLVQKSALAIGASVDHKIMGEVIDPEVFWSCTTCMACVEACPVGINHVDQIMSNRRNSVLMEGAMPSEAQPTLRALENRGNPFGAPEDRIKWLQDLDVKILKAGDSVDYLYWVGCVSAFDPRKQKIARSLVTLMKSAGLSFGILGTAEGCTGDPARRLGEENLFQTLAKNNIETFKSIRFHTLIANCPHCFHTIKNEYPKLGNLGEGREPQIIHHSQLLRRLMAEGKLNVKADGEAITFHDPCYLGRYNEEYDAPRSILGKASRLKIIEMESNKEKGLCCGAGGGHFWMDLKIGDRVNVLRTNEAAATGASTVATACPFCMQMMEDGVKLTDREGQLKVKDIAEVLAERLA
jgi:Fe-S oxidoreductase/nitrate reductase gamma subunit